MKTMHLLVMLASALFTGSALAELSCDTTATLRFTDNKDFIGATFGDCSVTVMVPEIQVIPGFSIDADGNVVTASWERINTRQDGTALPIDQLDGYIIEVNGVEYNIDHLATSWQIKLEEGTHTFRMQAVANGPSFSGWTDIIEKTI